MKNMMADKSKTFLVILILLFLALNTSAQYSSMLVYKSKEVIFEKEVAEIDSVKFYETGNIPSDQKETMFVYRDGIINFQISIADIDSVTFSKSTRISSLVLAGTLTPVVLQGCSINAAPPAVSAVTALEQLPGSVTINEGCSGEANLTVTSEDIPHGSCPVVINRIYTVKDDCGNIASVVQQITIQPNVQTIGDAVYIPYGSFMMGSPDNEVKYPGDGDDETLHEVTLSAFYMNKYEVTNSEYAKFLNDKQIGQDAIYRGGTYPDKTLIDFNQFGFKPWGVHYVGNKWIPWAGYENHPIVFVTWYGAMEYAKYAGGRLPTEAEWEYACRAGTSTPFSLGNGYCLTNLQANYDYRGPYDGCASNPFIEWHTEPVNSFDPNPWGLYHVHGNVSEWCSDWYGPYPSKAQINPTGSLTGAGRVVRGGGNHNVAHRLRSAYRGDFFTPEYASFKNGFRVAFSCSAFN